MKEITTSTTLTDLVNTVPEAAALFNSRGIDYCCGGDRPLARAAGEEEAEAIIAELREVDEGGEGAFDWQKLDTADLIDHIRVTHHTFTREQLKTIDTLMVRVLQVHFASHAEELLQVHRLFGALKTELEEHLIKEEELLFPMLTAAGAAGERLSAQVRTTDTEHEAAGELIHGLQEATRSFSAPDDGCASFRELYLRLKDLTEDIFMHIHKENILMRGVPAQ